MTGTAFPARWAIRVRQDNLALFHTLLSGYNTQNTRLFGAPRAKPTRDRSVSSLKVAVMMQGQADINPGNAVPKKKIFGFNVSPYTLEQTVEIISTTRRTAQQGVGLIATPNIDSIVKLHNDPDLVKAYEFAAIITCDGFPLYYFAQLRGLGLPGRVAGSDITHRLMREIDLPAWHKLFFVADSEASVAGLRRWAESRGLPPDMVAFAVPPFGFERDKAYCEQLALEITRHGTSILVLGVGAPKSELFVHWYRHALPPCWALCVGQSVKIEAGLMKRAPLVWQKLNAEWLWRITREPKRLTRRYAAAGVGFTYLALREMLGI
jgi:N-acetylglucosaminyldiphosphoundecaprenol N-acetyl-beta-D-mannosaminyltransferase